MTHHPGFHPPMDGWLAGVLIATAVAGILWTLRRREQERESE